jgi:hypothetical protein
MTPFQTLNKIMTPLEFCDTYKACPVGRDFAATQKTMEDVWNNCPNIIWHFWMTREADIFVNYKELLPFAHKCEKIIKSITSNPGIIKAVEAAKQFAYGDISKKEFKDRIISGYMSVVNRESAEAATNDAFSYLSKVIKLGQDAIYVTSVAYISYAVSSESDKKKVCEAFRKMVANPFT